MQFSHLSALLFAPNSHAKSDKKHPVIPTTQPECYAILDTSYEKIIPLLLNSSSLKISGH
jgi:hypothetical protein